MSHSTENGRLIEHNAVAHDIAARHYDSKHVEIFNPLEQARLAATVAEAVALAGRAGPEVLDVGAGTGNLGLKFLAAGCTVTAADVSAQSLERLSRKAPAGAALKTQVLTGERLPFADASFDIACCYSVLHHIPDYLLTVREMARVVRPGGLLYIDHESSPRSWSNDPILAEYRKLTRLTLREHVLSLLRTGEAFTPAFAKTIYLKAFVNRRYEREGDIHVWPDDHVEWDKVAEAMAAHGVRIERTQEYLHFVPRGGVELYERFRNRCSDMQFVFARKAA